jgi:hypothetical protein
MQKWEYLTVVYISRKDKQVPYYINGQEIKDLKNQPDMATHLNQLGQQGWEMVAYDFSGAATFKRPIT